MGTKMLPMTLLVAVMAVTGCGGGTATQTHAASPTASHGATATVASSSVCAHQALAWKNKGSSGQIRAVGNDLSQLDADLPLLYNDLVSGVPSAADESAVRQDGAGLQADAQAAQTNLPPSCIPHVREYEAGMLYNAYTAAITSQDMVDEIDLGETSQAITDYRQASVSIGLSDGMLTKFTQALTTWEKAGG